MDLTIASSFLPHTDPDASLTFLRDVLGFDVRLDVGYGGMRWITVGPADQPDTAIVLHPPTATPGLTDEELARIGDRFWRSSRHQNVKGSGLGLSICRALLAAGGGSITFAHHRAEEPHGLKVTVTVPRTEPGT